MNDRKDQRCLGNIYLAAGGTGGHLSPAIALCEELIRKQFKPFLIITEKDKRFPLLEDLGEKGINSYTYQAPKFPKYPWEFFRFFFQFLKALKLCKNWIKKDNPLFVIGFGGYASAPLLFQARKKIPFFLCEQNSYLGLVNRTFAPWAEKIFASFPLIEKSSSAALEKKILITGNPVRSEASFSAINKTKDSLSDLKKKAMKFFFADYKDGNSGKSKEQNYSETARTENKKIMPQSSLPIILVFGGSQGSAFLSDWAFNFIKTYKKANVILIVGNKLFDHYKLLRDQTGIDDKKRLSLAGFVQDMRLAYCLSDIAVTRAGGSLFELAAWQLPSVLVPFPQAANDHQEHNANYFAREFGFPISLQKDGFKALSERVIFLLSRKRLQKEIKSKLFQKKFDNSAQNIVSELCRFNK